MFADWQYECAPQQIKPQVVSGVWQRLTCDVMHEQGENAVRIYFWALQGATGTVWVDNVTVSPPVPGLRNLSFEETGEEGAIPGWNYPTDGVVSSDSTRSSDGKKSLRITLTDGTRPETCVWQEMPMDPGKEYTVSMDCFVGDDFVGTAQGYILGATPPHSTRQHNPNDTKAYPPRAANGKTVCTLTPLRDKPAALRQSVALKPGANLQACVEIQNTKLKGDTRLIVEDGTSKKVLGESTVRQTKAGWYLLHVPFVSQSPEIVLHVAAQGEGEVQVDNVAITPPQPTPPLQQVEWYPASENFRLPSPLRVSVEGKSGAVLDQGLSMLADDLKAKFGLAMERVTSGKAGLAIALGERHALEGKGDESYLLKINRKGMTIEAAREPGAFYGLMTVLQLLAKVEGGPVVLGCGAKDYPDMPMRGVLYGDPEQAARWKMNTLMYSSGYPTDGRARAEFADYVAKCQRLNLNLIPYFLTLDGGVLPTRTNPNLASGVWVKGEKVVLHGTTPSELANKYVIRTALSDATLTSLDGKKQYRLGEDYQVINGDIIGYPYEMPNPKPFTVARTEDSTIPDGATVLASYDYVSRYRESTGRTETHIPYCPVEPQAREIMGDFAKNLAKDFPFSYMHLSSCLEEFGPAEGMLATDSRCIKSGKTPIELLADSACFLDKAAKSGNPAVRISLWAGHVNEYSKVVGPKLPKDAMVNIWGYDASWPVTAGRASIAYWSKLGITTSVMPWYDVRNVDAWAQVVAEARGKGYPCLGIIDSCWQGTRVPDTYGGVEETAIVSWKIPRKGDRRYIELPSAMLTPAISSAQEAANVESGDGEAGSVR
ncbi:MAG: hypothetical protein HY318_08470 [Armatimonadetes bacterium]|nr:hypothetical protein [Armatimonadota bacterium]